MKTRIAYIATARLASLCLAMMSTPALAQTTPSAKEATMTARGPFDVNITQQDDKLNDGISRMVSERQYHGDLEGMSKGQMLAVGGAKSSGVYVAIETFTGTVQTASGEKKSGSFSLHHTGIMTNSTPELDIRVVPGSGTGQLAVINGKMKIIIAPDGKHSYEFEYKLPEGN